ncbi:hypothetical protein DOM21_15260 [Bacteriovorax stolpii]|uniref:DUF2490 domain-containing protein n=1 Tax=Bacteriovorax stolpii TaxID=960 RepID=A0A2K9NP30_BACTC|nr:hypothetical protein [Bacteriovorax stolpii]AUN97279.1 hypothetical protein C0V70_03965 [Bacteriovorax stolpii]QDK42783.1 hypothetical protein DOM21_15260 [Bacteriovorax stolpii]BDT27364.1 hypothetical protein BHI3_08300 [Bacteriovorax sp. HI3]
MFTKFLTVTGLFLSIFMGEKAHAHPVAYAGSTSIMTWNSKEMSDWMLTHSYTSKFSLAARYLRMDTRDGERTFYMPQVNYLLKRWNELDSQANIYLSLGHGGEKVNSSFKNTTGAALEADWESRKYYVSFREDVLLSHKDSKRNIYQTKVRAGFAPYLAEFNEMNAWFILQADKSNKMTDEYKLTPFIRLFYHNILLEFGSTMKGDSQFNFMVHF